MAQQSTRRNFLKQSTQVATGLLASSSILSNKSVAAEKPNIVLIVADDMGYADLSSYGSMDIQTPNIDTIARQGVRFTQHYANAAECTPTRTALLTGRYQQRVGGLECAIGFGHVGRYDDAIRLREQNRLGLPPSELTISKMLKQAGYRNGVIGKWHLGYDEKFLPKHHGFDYFWGPLGGGVDYFHHCEPSGWHTLRKNGEEVHREGYMTDLITEEAVKFIRREKDNPFFLYAAYTAPHTPYQGPDDYTEEHKTEETFNEGDRETYVEMVERLDWGVGQILHELHRLELEENTLVIFVSDNGGAKNADNGPFARGKGTLYEGGIHVPFMAKWPSKIEPGTVSDQVCLTLDLTASIAKAADVQPPDDRPFDGIDVLSTLDDAGVVTRTLFFRNRRGDRTWRAVRHGVWKYLSNEDGDEFEEYVFNLNEDPGEENDLKGTHPGKLEDLKSRLVKWEQEMAKTMR